MRPGGKNRSRGRNGRKPHPHAHPHSQAPMRVQTFDSAGPDVRIRGNAWQVHERYINMARDATAAGDRVAAENFFQHADHYYRMVYGEGRPQNAPSQPQQGQPQQGQPQQGQPQQGQPQQGQPPHGQPQHGQAQPGPNGGNPGNSYAPNGNGNGPGHGQSHDQGHGQGHGQGNTMTGPNGQEPEQADTMDPRGDMRGPPIVAD